MTTPDPQKEPMKDNARERLTRKPNMKTMYMHTIAGQPGVFDGQQICFSTLSRPIKLAESLRKIRKEQKATAKFRGGFKWSLNTYGYRLVAVPTKREKP